MGYRNDEDVLLVLFERDDVWEASRSGSRSCDDELSERAVERQAVLAMAATNATGNGPVASPHRGSAPRIVVRGLL